MDKKIGKIKEIVFGGFHPFDMEFENGISFTARMKDNNPEFVFRKNGSIVYDLASLVPKGTVFEHHPKNKFLAEIKDDGSNVVNFGKFNGPREILNLLHEIAHLYFPESDKKRKEVIEDLRIEKEKDKKNDYLPSRLLAMRNCLQVGLENEREAWDKALEFLGYLEKNLGIEIAAKIGNREGVESYIEKCMHVIKKNYLDELNIKADISSTELADIAIDEYMKISRPQPQQ